MKKKGSPVGGASGSRRTMGPRSQIVKPRGKSGRRRKVVAQLPRLIVKEIKFDSGIEIAYARIPDRRVTYVVAPSGDVHSHLSPPKVRPEGGQPHWRKSNSFAPEFSWPAVFIRDGGAAPLGRDVRVWFEAGPSFSGKLYVRATSPSGIGIGEQAVSFTNGVANDVAFKLQGLPSTIKWHSGVVLKWQYRRKQTDPYQNANATQHTFFIIDGQSLPSRIRKVDANKFLFEIYDWACRWSNGYTGHQAVLDALWRKFQRVRRFHDTGLVYWKNYQLGIAPEQTIAGAIQSQDDPDPMQRNAASCIVFDRVLINCLTVHGIRAAEIKIEPSPQALSRGGIGYNCEYWRATTTVAQGTANAPPGWQNHWIADVDTPSGWKLYDPSYGAGPANCEYPTRLGSVDVLDYEPLAVRSFEATEVVSGNVVSIQPDPDPAIPPHLKGWVLWPP